MILRWLTLFRASIWKLVWGWSLFQAHQCLLLGSDWRFREFLQVVCVCMCISWEFLQVCGFVFNSKECSYLVIVFSAFESELADVIPVVKTSISGTRIIGRLCAGEDWCLVCLLESWAQIVCRYSWEFSSYLAPAFNLQETRMDSLCLTTPRTKVRSLNSFFTN